MVDKFEPLWVRPKAAAVMLDCGVTKIYGLIESGALESCLDGCSRKISTASIRAFVARMLAAQHGQRVREPRGVRIAKRRRVVSSESALARVPRPPR
jgi:hypothetical protein